ncbi:MAG TPA: hypothetical protein PKH50_01710 [bacterium]|nr:hypothetical protein [bacterium]
MNKKLVFIFLGLLIVSVVLFFVVRYGKEIPISSSTDTENKLSSSAEMVNPFSKFTNQSFQDNLSKTNLGGPRYPGNGEIIAKVQEPYIIIISKTGERKPFVDLPVNADKYPENLYDIVDFPPQEYLFYAVGRFVGWEDIESADNSTDKYVLVKYTDDYNDADIHRFRVAVEASKLFDDQITGFYISYFENDSEIAKAPLSNKDPVSAGFKEITYEEATKLLEEEDPIVIFPVFTLPELTKRDGLGNYLSSFVVIRKHIGN